MATIALASLAPAPEEPVHLLPCTIAHDGPAKVSTYFVITPEHSLPAEKTDPPRSAKKEEADEVVATLGSQSKEEDEAARATVDSPLLRGDETQDSGYASVADGSPRLSGTEELALRGSKSGTQTAHGAAQALDPHAVFETSFRGRKLKGKHLILPEDYRGYVMETSYKVTSAAHETPDEEDQDMTAHERHTEPERELRASAQFSSIMVWGHDDPPRPYEHHLFKTVNSWVKLSKALHAHIDPSEQTSA